MRALTLLTIALLLAAAPNALAQETNSQSPATGASPAIHAKDGGTTEFLQSIFIPPKANAPFQLRLHTEWARNLAGGGTITLENERPVARDSTGRIYQERWDLVPKNGRFQSTIEAVQILDPIRHVEYYCFMQDRKNICQLRNYTPTNVTRVQMGGPPPGPLGDNRGYASRDDLGQQEIAGAETTGTRETITINPGELGNDTPLLIEHEYWYSPQLGINLLSKSTDPRFGTQTFSVIELTTSEPDPHLFDLPAGFKILDLRPKAAVPTGQTNSP